MDITIIGLGYVGLANAIYLASLGNQITGYDIDKNKISLLHQGVCTIEEPGLQELLTDNIKNLRFTTYHKDAIRLADVIFICVDTPQGKEGSVDLTNFNSVLETICEDSTKDATIVIRSTVPVGTNKIVQEYMKQHSKNEFDIISFPEFLSQGKALENMQNPYRLIFGINELESKNVVMNIINAFNVNPKKTPTMITTPENAELIKYASNCFLAMKVSYINNIAQLCEKVGADVEKVARGMALDPRIGDSMLKAGIGYGGSCFPKDTNGLFWIANDNSVPMELVRSTMLINESQVEFYLNKIYKRFKSVSSINVSILGLAFKGDTEDIRGSQAIPVIKSLLERGANLKVYDPLAMDNFHEMFSRYSRIKYVDYAQDALKGADVVLILNDCDEFKKLTALDFISLMRKPVIFDGRNLYSLKSMEGTEYYSIGRRDVKDKTKSRK